LIRPPREDELEEISGFVAAQQAHAESRDAMLAETPAAIATQLAGWETSWVEVSRIAERRGGLVGFVGADLDESLRRTWIHGPVVADPDWHGVADRLLASLETETPGLIRTRADVMADVANVRIAAFAQRHGFVVTEEQHLLALPADLIDELPRPEVAPIWAPHEGAFVLLHENAFPGTYYSGQQLLDQAARGEAVLLGVVEEGALAGYAAARLDEEGDGYVDFVAVVPELRRRGAGQALVAGIAHALRARRDVSAIRLTVSSENTAALALYDSLGFTRQSSAVGYRRDPEPSA
jgi:ribosomal protein S18 acetylase RimI-like enzyme